MHQTSEPPPSNFYPISESYMSRRIVAAVVAGILALLGAVILISYVNSADERAMAELDPVEVLVVSAPIAQGTPAEEIAASVVVDELPSAAVGPGAVTDLATLRGRVAATDLRSGEQILTGRFASPQELVEFGGIPVPDGHHQVTISLDASRTVGGTVSAGDTVGVFITVGDQTHLALHKILVTRVQGGLSSAQPAEGESADSGAAPVPEGGSLVTLAVNARDAETLIFASEQGSIWLTLEDPEAPTDGTRVVNPGNLY